MKVSPATEQYILDNCPPYCVRPDAPDTYRDLKKVAAEENVIPVFGEPDKPVFDSIFSSPEVHYAFRAWHDALHIEHDQNFTLKGEMMMAGIQYAVLRHAGIDITSAQLIYLNTAAQVEYYYATKGQPMENRFVKSQERFVTDAFEHGICKAIEFEKLRHSVYAAVLDEGDIDERCHL